ncbi:hypothetical protein [Pantoea ananatis]|uniref:hypothetical protein n=1 Tax=Pantoea ananas TaxID=553 RepID=UPI003F9DE050
MSDSQKKHELHFKKISSQKILKTVAVASGLIAVLSFISFDFYNFIDRAFDLSFNQTGVAIIFSFTSFIIFSFLYLQSGGKIISRKATPELLDSEKILKELSNQKEWAIAEVASLNKKIKIFESDKGLSADEKKTIISNAAAKVSEDAIKTIFEKETYELQNKIKEQLGFERLTNASERIIFRLRREITDLRLRSNINLLIGMSITAGGLYLLWSTISMIDTSELLKELASEGNEANVKFIKSLTLPIIPRVSLVIFIEIFAYFFLRLYKNGLDEIKYFQNELTNIESKLAAVEFSFITSNTDGLKTSIEALSKTERNFVLEKGQTTVELERAKSDSELTKNLVRTIPRLLRHGKSK